MKDSSLIPKKRTWDFIKNKISANDSLVLDYIERKNHYRVFCVDGNTYFFVNLFDPTSPKSARTSPSNNADYSEFVSGYKTGIDDVPPTHIAPVKLANISTDGNKLQIHQSSRPSGISTEYSTVWVGAGDDVVNHKLGEGQELVVETTVDQPVSSIDIEFDPVFGQVFIHEGFCSWANAGHLDSVTSMVYAKPSQMQQAANLDYELDGDLVKYSPSGPGNGTHGLAATPVLYPNKNNTGYWNYTPESGLTPSFGQTGAYDFSVTETEINKFFNKIQVFGSSNYLRLQSSDYSELPENFFVRLKCHNNSNTVWSARVIITMYRERTVTEER